MPQHTSKAKVPGDKQGKITEIQSTKETTIIMVNVNTCWHLSLYFMSDLYCHGNVV